MLLAVDGPANEAKGDDDASEWLPDNRRFACAYVATQITIKTEYGLWVTPSEHDAMAATWRTVVRIRGDRSYGRDREASQKSPADLRRP